MFYVFILLELIHILTTFGGFVFIASLNLRSPICNQYYCDVCSVFPLVSVDGEFLSFRLPESLFYPYS